MNAIRYVGSLLLVVLCLNAAAQHTWQGRLIDRQTNEPLSFVSIYVASRQVGTVANADGQFVLKVPNVAPKDTVAFSLIGYETYRIPLQKLGTGSLTIPLSRAVTTLVEVTVRPVDAEELVQQAIRKVSKNYPNQPMLLQGFYREWVREKPYLVFAEGTLEMYKASYGGLRDDEVRLLKGRRKPLLPYVVAGTDTCRIPNITNGPHLGILLDIVKPNTDNTFLSYARMYEYTFEYAGMTSLDGNDLYIIGFKAKPDIATAFFSGKLLIDRDSKAIVQAEYVLSKQGMLTVNRLLSLNRLPMRLIQRRYQVNYRRQGDRWLLQHVQAANEYRYTLRPIAPITSQMDFIVTKTITNEVHRFTRKEMIRVDQTFAEEIRTFDDSFWGEENIMVEEQK